MRALALVIGAATVVVAPVEAQTAIAVVVHPDNPIVDISLNDLRRIFEGRTTTLGGAAGVQIYQHRASREVFFDRALNTTVSRATRDWIGRVFSGGDAIPPIDIETPGELLDEVARRTSGIGFLPFADADPARVKVLRVEGLSPIDPAYPIS